MTDLTLILNNHYKNFAVRRIWKGGLNVIVSFPVPFSPANPIGRRTFSETLEGVAR